MGTSFCGGAMRTHRFHSAESWPSPEGKVPELLLVSKLLPPNNHSLRGAPASVAGDVDSQLLQQGELGKVRGQSSGDIV